MKARNLDTLEKLILELEHSSGSWTDKISSQIFDLLKSDLSLFEERYCEHNNSLLRHLLCKNMNEESILQVIDLMLENNIALDDELPVAGEEDIYFNTPLSLAIKNIQYEAATKLIEKGARLNVKITAEYCKSEYYTWATPVQIACVNFGSNDKTKELGVLIKLMISRGADLNMSYLDGVNALELIRIPMKGAFLSKKYFYLDKNYHFEGQEFLKGKYYFVDNVPNFDSLLRQKDLFDLSKDIDDIHTSCINIGNILLDHNCCSRNEIYNKLRIDTAGEITEFYDEMITINLTNS